MASYEICFMKAVIQLLYISPQCPSRVKHIASASEVGEWMGGWMDGWMDGMDGRWMDGWEDGKILSPHVRHLSYTDTCPFSSASLTV